jgi:hypothetical protein
MRVVVVRMCRCKRILGWTPDDLRDHGIPLLVGGAENRQIAMLNTCCIGLLRAMFEGWVCILARFHCALSLLLFASHSRRCLQRRH